jgi:hypothetical protein
MRHPVGCRQSVCNRPTFDTFRWYMGCEATNFREREAVTMTQEDGESLFGTVRLWTSLVILSGGLLAVLFALRSAQQYLGIQEFWYGLFPALFISAILSAGVILKTRIAASQSAILRSMRVLAVVLAFVAASLLVLHWLQPVDDISGQMPVATIDADPPFEVEVDRA